MRSISLFIALSFGLSWAVAIRIHAMGGLDAMSPAAAMVWLMVFMLGPAIAAICTALVFDRGRLADALGFAGFRWPRVLKWSLVGWALPILVTLAAIAASVLVGGQDLANPADAIAQQLEESGADVPLSAQQLFWIQLAVGLPIGLLFNTVFLLFSEELGWRGWLAGRLGGIGFWQSSLLIGLIWGVWHAPIILMGHNYGDLGFVGVVAMIGLTTAVSPYLGLVRERGGVIAAAAMHGSINAVGGIGALLLPNAAWPWNGLLGLGGLIVLCAGWPLLALIARRPAANRSAEQPAE